MCLNNLQKMQQEAASLLKDCRMVIGYTRGTFAHLDRTAIITKPEEAGSLTFGPTSIPNLTLYLVEEMIKPLKKGEKPDPRPVAVVCKGCDAKTIAELTREHIFTRDQVKVIGMPCSGVIDIRRLTEVYGENNGISEISWGKDGFLINGTPPKEDILARKCLSCGVRNPTITDVKGFEPVAQPAVAGYDDLKAIEEMDLDERWAFFKPHLEHCIRCYACRNVCPLCYCTHCSIDMAKPYRWTEKLSGLSDNSFYHIMRALHLAGRCIDCGECERVCPVNVPLRLLNKAMARCAKEKFGIEPGKEEERPTLLGGCSERDKEDFIW